MLPTFVIGLREGLEAALIVGIIAAFLRKQGRRDLLRWVLSGVGVAIALCVAAGVALHAFSQDLPQKQQEGLETIIGLLAVGMVTYMVVWMRRNSRGLKGQLEGMAADAMGANATTAGRAARAMVAMAFLAVIREGVETVIFVLAAFNEAGSGTTAGLGLLLGIAIAVALGYGIYRGGVRINLSKFFRATGIVLVLVAAGILVNALHTAHEAGWLTVGQGTTVDLSWLVQPGTVQASLLTGMLGIQSHPVVIELVGWLAYLIPVGVYVAWPPGKAAPARTMLRASAAVCAVAGLAAAALAVTAPAAPAAQPTTRAGEITAQATSRTGDAVALRTRSRAPIAGTLGAVRTYRLPADGAERHGGTDTDVFRATVPGVRATGLPATVSPAQLAARNGGRLPLGLTTASGTLQATYRDTTTLTAWLDRQTDRVLDVSWSETVTMAVTGPGGRTYTVDRPVASVRTGFTAAQVATAVAAAASDHHAIDRRALFHTLAWWLLALAVLALAFAVSFALVARRQPPRPVRPEPVESLVRS